MAAKITYTQGGSDPASIRWPPNGPQQWTFATGTPQVISELISYPGSGVITFADGREFPRLTSQGSLFVSTK